MCRSFFKTLVRCKITIETPNGDMVETEWDGTTPKLIEYEEDGELKGLLLEPTIPVYDPINNKQIENINENKRRI